MSKITEYAKTAELSSGLPVGDTYIDLQTSDFSPTEFTNEAGKIVKSTRLKTQSGKEYNIPKTVVLALSGLAEKNVKWARVTRTGTGLHDTSYTILEQVPRAGD